MQWCNQLMSIWLQRSQDSLTEQICQEVEYQAQYTLCIMYLLLVMHVNAVPETNKTVILMTIYFLISRERDERDIEREGEKGRERESERKGERESLVTC